MTAWEEAVKAVPHATTCVTRTEFAECSCDRDARIAKGIEAAVSKVGYIGVTLHHVALAAFKEASR